MAVFQAKPSQKPHKNFYAYYRKDLTRIRYKRRTPPAVTIYRGNFAPKKFTGKEQDQETGLYYFGARYLDPKTSRWLSTDPALGDYLPVAPNGDDAKKHNQNLPGMGGVFNVVNLHVYHYAGNNPVKLVDPDGRQSKTVYYFQVDVYRSVDGKSTDLYGFERRMYFSTNSDILDSLRDKVRKGLITSGLRRRERMSAKDQTDRYAGRTSTDPPNLHCVVDVGVIGETEVVDVSPTEEDVLDSGIIEQSYIVKNNDGTESPRLVWEKSIDENGKYTDQVNEYVE